MSHAYCYSDTVADSTVIVKPYLFDIVAEQGLPDRLVTDTVPDFDIPLIDLISLDSAFDLITVGRPVVVVDTGQGIANTDWLTVAYSFVDGSQTHYLPSDIAAAVTVEHSATENTLNFK
ncbi:hypothetical protein QYM36_005695 [Artemia franciscana]|uniref:Uncharacterized protein n=1 Tax=Artemia franciscana TaxID=6661 RepID=A0AA88I029_ARTSF|nr:hypothetical protein QYM36_005695 [Artemia franciscana]